MSLLDRLSAPQTLEQKLQQQMYGGQAPIVERSEYSRNLPPAPAPAPAQKPSFFDKARAKLADPAYRAQLASAFNTMRMNPDPSVSQRALDMSSANQTVQYLEQQGHSQLAQAVRANPALATDAMKSIIGTNYAKQSSGIQTDPVTGQQYVTEYDPNTGVGRRVDVTGAIGETPTQKAQREADQAFRLQDVDDARSRGVEIFDAAEQIDRSINIMKQARDIVAQGDVQTGLVERYLPAFNANTALFRSLRTTLGIDVINSATFGALSEAELNLALSKDIPDSLEGPALVEYLDRKIQAQNKLYREMTKKARYLQSGISLSEYMGETAKQVQEGYDTLAAYPIGDPNMTYALWNEMTSDDRKAYLEADK
jgi:hypothetical protein